jgi:hypothetical protein
MIKVHKMDLRALDVPNHSNVMFSAQEPGANSYDRELQRQSCKNLQRHK